MNTNRHPKLRNCAAFLALALALALPGVVTAEVGVYYQAGTSVPGTVYILNGLTEDPSPIGTVWRKLGTNNVFRVDLNSAGEQNGDGAPSLVKDLDHGLVAAAWARNSANGFDVVISRFADGAWTNPQVVVGGTSDALDPSLVTDASGTVHLFYWVDGSTPQVFHVSAPSDLSSWSAPLRVSDIAMPSCRPSAGFAGGVLRVAYEVHNMGVGHAPRQVVLARLQGGTFEPEVVSVTNNLGSVQPEVHSYNGKLWVDWIDFEDGTGGGELAWTRLDAQGQWEPIQYEPFADFEHREYLVRGGARMQVISLP